MALPPGVSQERRKYKRWLLDFPVKMGLAKLTPEDLSEGSLVDLSIQGAAVESLVVVQPGDEMKLSFSLRPEVDCEIVNAKAIFCRQVTADRYLTGVHFIDFRSGDFEKLTQYLKMLKVLQATTLFNQLSVNEIRKLLAISREESVNVDREVFHEGMAAQALYVVLSGVVKISKKNSKGVDEPLALIREGEVFGEMALLDDYPRGASATAHRDITLLRIGSAEFKQVMKEQGTIANKLLWVFVRVLCHRLREADKQIVETFSSATGSMGSIKG